jgi:hypothetical protein
VSFWLVSGAAIAFFRRGWACFVGAFFAREAGALFLETFFVVGFFMCRHSDYGMGCGFCDISSSKRLSVRKVANSESVYTFWMSL